MNEQLDELTVSIQKQQREAGKSFVSRTRIEIEAYDNQPITVFRVVLANPLTTEQDLEAILAEQVELAENHSIWHDLSQSMPVTQAKIA
jgi:glutamate decarboxylase